MASRSNSGAETQIVAPDRVRELIKAMIAGARAKGRTLESIAVDSGVALDTIKGWINEGKEPSLSKALSVMCIIGERAVNSTIAVIGYGGAAPLDEATSPNLRELTAHLISGVSVIANAAADGRIDHTEEGPCREAADMIIAEVLPLSSAGRAA